MVAQKTSHTALAIVFKLAARWDVESMQLPRRQILRDVCTHTSRYWNPVTLAFDYRRTTSCPYAGSLFFDTFNRPTDAEHDQCSRSMTGCTRRFGGSVLPARFFPGVAPRAGAAVASIPDRPEPAGCSRLPTRSAVEAYPEEAAGIVTWGEYQRLANLSTTPDRDVLLTDADLVRVAEAELFFHSHPDGSAAPPSRT